MYIREQLDQKSSHTSQESREAVQRRQQQRQEQLRQEAQLQEERRKQELLIQQQQQQEFLKQKEEEEVITQTKTVKREMEPSESTIHGKEVDIFIYFCSNLSILSKVI